MLFQGIRTSIAKEAYSFLIFQGEVFGEGPKGQISINIIKFQLQRFLHQTLCVFSQMKDIKLIRRDFHLAALVMRQGWDLGVPRGLGMSKKKFPKIQPILVCELLT